MLFVASLWDIILIVGVLEHQGILFVGSWLWASFTVRLSKFCQCFFTISYSIIVPESLSVFLQSPLPRSAQSSVQENTMLAVP